MNYGKIKEINKHANELLKAAEEEREAIQNEINLLSNEISNKEKEIENNIFTGSETDFKNNSKTLEDLKAQRDFKTLRVEQIKNKQLLTQEDYNKMINAVMIESKKEMDILITQLVAKSEEMAEIGAKLEELAEYTNNTLDLIQHDLYRDFDRQKIKGHTIGELDKKQVDKSIYTYIRWALIPVHQYGYELATGNSAQYKPDSPTWLK